jgi:hypothetical protein
LLDGRSRWCGIRRWPGFGSASVAGQVQQGVQRLPDLRGEAAAAEFRSGQTPQIGFPGGGIDLDAGAKARLQVMLEFMKADPTVNHIELDGHSDNSGNRLTNRDLSRARAGGGRVLQGQWHRRIADHRALPWRALPLVPNNNAANRAKNRRVSVKLARWRRPPRQRPRKPAQPANAAATS